METLIQILRRAKDHILEKGILFLPEDENWVARSPALMIPEEGSVEDRLFKTQKPPIAKEHKLTDTLDDNTIIEIVDIARKSIENPPGDGLLIEAFIYYYRYDAHLPKAGYNPKIEKYDPDMVFYNSLGEESQTQKCKREECMRGKISGSVLCRVHHFEMIMKKHCPYKH